MSEQSEQTEQPQQTQQTQPMELAEPQTEQPSGQHTEQPGGEHRPLQSKHHADEHDNPVTHAASAVADGTGDALLMMGQAVSGPPLHDGWEDKVADYDRQQEREHAAKDAEE